MARGFSFKFRIRGGRQHYGPGGVAGDPRWGKRSETGINSWTVGGVLPVSFSGGTHGGLPGDPPSLAAAMLTPGPLTKIYLAAGTTDLRAGFEKLTILAQAFFAQSPTCGHYFLFCNAARTRLKVLCWDGSGLWLCVKRLERGRFAWPPAPPASVGSAVGSEAGSRPMTGASLTLSAAELTLLLAGIDLTRTQHRKWWGRPEGTPPPLSPAIPKAQK